jgi:alpha-aminoadipic semialdehyde synthase
MRGKADPKAMAEAKRLMGVRREDKNRWERRVPVVPGHLSELRERHGIELWIQPSEIRVFQDEEYERAGARICDDLSPCPVVLAVKEIPPDFFRPRRTYVFFSHVIKGQRRNMPMLRRLLDLKCQLIDYEKIVDENGKRLVFFGIHAGYAGMIDTLWAFGKRLEWEGIPNAFTEIQQAYRYESLAEAKAAIGEVGRRIASEGLPEPLVPVICGFLGYGNVSLGAQEIFDLLPHRVIEPGEEPGIVRKGEEGKNLLYKVVYKEEHMVAPTSPGDRFDLQEYYRWPGKYRATFSPHIPHLTLLVSCIYWDDRYPRLVTKRYLRELFGGPEKPRLRVVGDITCDVDGSMECNVREADTGNPVYVYDPRQDRAVDGWEGRGPVVLAVSNLPCELPRESSTHFSTALRDFLPRIAEADYSLDFSRCDLPDPLKKAVIAWHGELTPEYRYIEKYL